MPKIITISREFGSGGRELGRRIADELGWAYYDQEILHEMAKNTDYSKEYLASFTESGPVRLMPITYAHSFYHGNQGAFDQSVEVFTLQSNTIKQMALKSDCVIIGRCADYILRDYHPLRIFVYSNMASKVERCLARNEEKTQGLDEKAVIKEIKKVDKRRRKYYEFYTYQKWGDRNNYDVMINTSGQDIKALAKMLVTKVMHEEDQ